MRRRPIDFVEMSIARQLRAQGPCAQRTPARLRRSQSTSAKLIRTAKRMAVAFGEWLAVAVDTQPSMAHASAREKVARHLRLAETAAAEIPHRQERRANGSSITRARERDRSLSGKPPAVVATRPSSRTVVINCSTIAAISMFTSFAAVRGARARMSAATRQRQLVALPGDRRGRRRVRFLVG